jgi:hypothetical protein
MVLEKKKRIQLQVAEVTWSRGVAAKLMEDSSTPEYMVV